MGIGGILRRITGRRAPAGLLSGEEFRALLARERLRSDRSGAAFSLVAFTCRPPGDAAAEHALGRILRERLRATDDAGQLADGRLAALLPETHAAGAWTLADDISHRAEAAGSLIECQVFQYPPHVTSRRESPRRRSEHLGRSIREYDQEDDNGSAGEAGDPSEAGAERVVREQRPALRGNSNAGENGNSQRPVDSIEVLMAQGLPVWKRTLDLVGAVLLLVAVSPLMLASVLAVKLTSRGPALFAQRRDGLGGRPFTMYKFRTMTVDADQRKGELRRFSEQDGPAFKMTNDPRVTRAGRLLRATSIDELPQLWNVLRGEMSLVGPRPLPCDESAACRQWQRRRLDVTPGLTCIWQVAGRSLVSFAEWARMDLRYVDRRTPLHDLKLLLQTLPALLLKRGK